MNLTDADLDLLLRSADPFPEQAATPSVIAALDDALTSVATSKHLTNSGSRSRRVLAGLAAGGLVVVGGVAAAATIESTVSNTAPDFGTAARSATTDLPLPPGDDIGNYITVTARGDAGLFDRDGLRVYFSYDAVCAWQGYWLQAHDTGDAKAATQALDVLEAIPTWPQWLGNVDASVTAAYRSEAEQAAIGDAAPVRQAWAANCTGLPRAWAAK